MIQDYTMVFLMLMILQNDLNSVYECASDNNMFFNAQKFQYICFNPHTSFRIHTGQGKVREF